MFGRKRASKVDRNKTDEKILDAVLTGDEAKLRSLIEKGKFSSLLSADDEGRYPLYEACRLGLTGCAEAILAVERETLQPDELGRTPLHISALNGQAECVSLLLKRGAPGTVDAKDGSEQTALHCAAGSGNVDAMEALIAHQADGELRNKDGATPLLVAVKADQVETATALMNNSANVNAQNLFQKTALMFACENGNVELTRLLLSRGAKADMVDAGGRTAKGYAASGNHQACLDALPASAPDAGPKSPSPQPASNPFASFADEPVAAPLTAAVAEATPAAAAADEPAAAVAVDSSWPGVPPSTAGADNATLAAANQEIAELKAQLAAFTMLGDESVQFDSADELEVGDDPFNDKRAAAVEADKQALKAHVAKLTVENQDLKEKVDRLLDLEGEPALRRAAEARAAALAEEAEALRAQLSDAEERAKNKPREVDVVPTAVMNQMQQENNRKIAALEQQLAEAANGGSGNHAAEIAAYRRQLLLAVQGKLSAEVTAALQKVLDEGGDTAAGSPEASSPSGEVMM